ncbi:MAG TPA: PIN domain-containing protein [Pyrinomonadaceae bacterium]|jgi:rRNA-processing protein FCF1|nr:PIN domain-containing protein [Pyrinomonadaceae bacterium]
MNYVKDLLSRYSNKGILIDTNLLLLYFVGKYKPSEIPKFKRTAAFEINDFRLLLSILRRFNRIVTTPNILTEVSNLSNQLPNNSKLAYNAEFASQVLRLDEKYIPSSDICSLDHFRKFGLTDSGIIESAKNQYLVLTDDFKLTNFLEKIKVDVINFNHIRLLRLLS